jgi:hypothetical protein
MELTLRQKWHAFLGMTKRNILVYFKDKTTIFFSLLAPLIVLFLYLAFLMSLYVNSVSSTLEEYDLVERISSSDITSFVNAWLVSGLLGSSLITVSLNSLSVMVDDKYNQIDKDYGSSPINGAIVVFSYFVGAFANTALVGCFLLTTGLVVMAVSSPFYVAFSDIIILYLLILFGSASATLFLMIVVSFFKKSSALGAFSGVVSAAVGFMIGAYMPMASMAKPVQFACNLFPGSHVAGLFRNFLMQGSLEHMNAALSGVDGGAFLAGMKQSFSFSLYCFGTDFGVLEMFLYSGAILLFSLLMNMVFYRFSSRRR